MELNIKPDAPQLFVSGSVVYGIEVRRMNLWLVLELERAQNFRARVGLGLGSGSGSAKFGSEPIGLSEIWF